MKRNILSIVLFLFIFSQGFSQIRLTHLVIKSKEVYQLQGTDILVVDSLVLEDSAKIILNLTKKDNFLHVKKLVSGRGSIIVGRGIPGIPGKTGITGLSNGGPCRSGNDGQPGMPGIAGKDAVNLLLYADELIIKGTLIIDLSGGDGGEGGKGGLGGDGNSGTKLCQGGSGGDGGNGGAGGNGGNSGNLTVISRYGTDLRSWMGEKIIVRSFAGFAGQGGDGGLGGERGLSTSKDGEQGKKGKSGTAGVGGKPGGIFFERK
jgi:hypothetical protein